MKKSSLRSLGDRDSALMLETRRKNLETLTEDDLVALHSRVLRGRNRHVTNYRRAGAARVKEAGLRGGAHEGNRRNRERAAAFEGALARVSKRLAVVAKASADQLRDERLATAALGKGMPESVAQASASSGKTDPGRAKDRRVKTPVKKKEVAGRAAAGARKQARKDNRGR